MNAIYHGSRGSSSRAKKRRGRQQDLVGPLQLPDLRLELLDPRGVVGRRPGRSPGIDLGLLAPAAQRVRRSPRPAARSARTAAFNDSSGSSLTGLATSRIARSRSSCGYFLGAGMIPSSRGIRPSTEPGAVHRPRKILDYDTPARRLKDEHRTPLPALR